MDMGPLNDTQEFAGIDIGVVQSRPKGCDVLLCNIGIDIGEDLDWSVSNDQPLALPRHRYS